MLDIKGGAENFGIERIGMIDWKRYFRLFYSVFFFFKKILYIVMRKFGKVVGRIIFIVLVYRYISDLFVVFC